MSWMNRAQTGGPPAPGSDQPPYSATQNPYGNQQHAYQNYPTNAPANVNPQQYWQMQGPQQYDNANQVYQQNNQSVSMSQPGYHPNYSHFNQNQPNPQQKYTQNQQNVDGWQDNWDWAWDESAKQTSNRPHTANSQQTSAAVPAFIPQQQSYNNANVIEESFTSSDTWNWAMSDKKEDSIVSGLSNEAAKVTEHQFSNQASGSGNKIVNEPVEDRSAIAHTPQIMTSVETHVKTLNDRDIVKEKMPNLALGKRLHLDALTPQWSIESQMSQESSDGPQTHSESTYRSENQSRSSNKSSPGLNTDNSNFNYVHLNTNDTAPHDIVSSKNPDSDSLHKYENFQKSSIDMQSNPEDLAVSLQEMNLSNRENITPDLAQSTENNTSHSQDSLSNPNVNVPPPPSVHIPPPTNFPPVSPSQNPFKHPGSFSHKNAVKVSNVNPAPVSQPGSSTFPKESEHLTASNSLTSPSVINKISQQRGKSSYYHTANLETTPDNSERPDHPQVSNFRKMPTPQTAPENLEVAPKNDRNEYLQTAHLSGGDYGENIDFTRDAPPVGLRRMVVGQQEGEYSQTLSLSSDEPPPGLSRMVPGQQNESDNAYSQPNDDYLGRHIDGQFTDVNARNSYRQADGQQTNNNYMPNTSSRSGERRPIGFDRMVPGEPSIDDYSRAQQYQNTNYSGSSEHRVVTGVDYDYPQISQEGNVSEIREQNVDGSDYMEHMARNVTRNVVGAREPPSEISLDYNPQSVPDLDQTRELTVEGENLQDLSVVSSADLSFSRDQPLDGADMTVTDLGIDRKTDASDSIDLPLTSSRRQSLNRTNTSGDDSERDKAFKASPKRDRDKHKASRDKDIRHTRENRKYDRDSDRRSGRDRDDRDRRSEKERREKDRDRKDYKDDALSPDGRRHRRSNRTHRYETEDTDYYSDHERERRRYREGSYVSSKPPRPDDKERRYREDKDRNRRYATMERERRHDPDPERHSSSRRRTDRDRGREDVDRKYDDRRYRDIDPEKKYGNIRREKEERRRGEPGEEERVEGRGEERARRRPRRDRDRHYDPYYEGYGAAYSDPYMLHRQQQQTFQYYEQLRLSNPAAYMEIYKKLMAGQPLAAAGALGAAGAGLDPSRGASYLEGYGVAGYEARGEERGSVHSGRSSANGLTGKDTPRSRYYAAYRAGAADASSVRDAPSLRTDVSDRDFTTDASLNLQLEESVRSERMTPLKFATAHVKGSLSSRHLVVVRASYGRALGGRPAAVHVLRLSAALADDAQARELDAYPGPLLPGVTHKKSVIEYCEARLRGAERRAGADLHGYVLIWELLALLLRQNGTIVGSDIAELLMNNVRQYEYTPHTDRQHYENGRGGSAASSTASRSGRRPPRDPADDVSPADPLDVAAAPPAALDGPLIDKPERDVAACAAGDSTEKLDRLRELLIYGNRQQALEWAMSNSLWGHALHLAAWSDRRTRAAAAARFVAAQPPADPLHTLYAALAGRPPPVATAAADARGPDWRPHLAVLLANPSAKPDFDKRTVTQLGDSLATRGLVYSAQFCYLTAGVEWGRHPLAPLSPGPAPPAPPRLALLLAPARAARLQQLATDRAIFATEIYEYARCLHDPDYVIAELQVYKLVLASRLADCGRDARALGYAEAAARAVARAPHLYSPRFIAQLAEFADRLKYHEESLHEVASPVDEAVDGAEGEAASPRHLRWLHELQALAHAHTPPPSSPAHYPVPLQQTGAAGAPEPAPLAVPLYWTPDQTAAAQYQQHPPQLLQQEQLNYPAEQPPGPAVAAAPFDHAYDYTGQYYGHGEEVGGGGYGGEWARAEPERAPRPADEPPPYAYHEAEELRPQITMPGEGAPSAALYHRYDDSPGHSPGATPGPAADSQERDTDTPGERSQSKKEEGSKRREENAKGANAKSGWLGGILTKLSLRPPNQMILPDDKNPRIVWDADNKRWIDLDADGEEAEGPPPPPPVAMPAPLAASSAAPASNIFKMQKNRRNIKNSYVDVFNPSGAPTRPLPPAAEVLGPAAAAPAPAPSYFVPAPQQ